MLTTYATVLVFMLVAVAFVFGSLLVGRFVRPRPPAESQGAKLEAYESGEEAVRTAWFNFNPRFYLVALVFLIFDVEIAFILPVAAVFKRWTSQSHAMGARALVEIFAFIAVLLFGLAYAWKKGDLEWIRTAGGAVPAGASLSVVRSRAGSTTQGMEEEPQER